MTEDRAQAESHNPIGDQPPTAENPKKKKASWARTILWMLSMVLLVNVLFAILAYVLHQYKII